MKRMFFMLILAVSTCALSFAQDSSVVHKKRAASKTSIAKQINLSKEQQDKIKASKQDLKTKTAAINANKSLTDEQKKAQIKAAKKENKTKVQAVYTPEQKAKLKQIRVQKKANSPQKKKAPPKSTKTANN